MHKPLASNGYSASENRCVPSPEALKYGCWEQMGSAFGDHRVQVQPGSMAADTRESENSEHQSGSGDQHSMCQQGAPDSASPSTKVETAEGAGETGEPQMLLGSSAGHLVAEGGLPVIHNLHQTCTSRGVACDFITCKHPG